MRLETVYRQGYPTCPGIVTPGAFVADGLMENGVHQMRQETANHQLAADP